MVKLPGDYPDKKNYETIIKKQIHIGSSSLLIVLYESNKSINIFIGGPEKWCIHCEVIKNKSLGYLIKIRYDILCSLNHNFAKGKDTKQILNLLIQYIYINYSYVKELSFNDLSIKKCDNKYDMNLAVMTYLYTGKTWYEKNFNAYIASHCKNTMKQYIHKLNESKLIDWDEMKDTITMEYPHIDILYEKSDSWKEFFETIYNNLEIADFCNALSPWIDSFILKFFNNLQGLTYCMPIEDKNIKYTEHEYIKGGRFTRKNIRNTYIDYK